MNPFVPFNRPKKNLEPTLKKDGSIKWTRHYGYDDPAIRGVNKHGVMADILTTKPGSERYVKGRPYILILSDYDGPFDSESFKTQKEAKRVARQMRQ